ncbi:MAG: large conductance mechanosensitive channel protein MscL [Clostridia bacterium]|nr:large conductance mechanosensitive channel protein MscL [Clostridia bacterium]
MRKTPKWLIELKEFAMRGNVIDLAVGVIIGGAFQAIIKSLINDLVMPFVGLITGGVNFVDQFVVLRLPEGAPADTIYKSLEEATAAGATTFNYGAFITAVLNFAIMVIVIFFMIKFINKMTRIINRKKEEAEEETPTTKTCPFCCSEIAIEATRCPHCTSVLEE